eukprot:560895-Pyramimonas_sp.AAC.1
MDWPTNVPDYYAQPESLSASRPKAPMTPAPKGAAPSQRGPGTPVEKQGEPDTKKSRELAQPQDSIQPSAKAPFQGVDGPPSPP